MDLKEILSVTGKRGLYKLVSHEKNRIIVESLEDKTRIPVFASSRPSSLDNICIFTDEGDMTLKDVFKLIFQVNNGDKVQNNRITNDVELKKYMAEILPNYDRTKVHASDMKKIFSWYNILQEKNLLSFDETEEIIEAKSETRNE